MMKQRRNVLFGFKMPKDSYFGGIAVILKNYTDNFKSFLENDYSVNIAEPQYVNRIFNFCSILENLLVIFPEYKYYYEQLKKDDSLILHIHTSRKWLLLKDLILIRLLKAKFANKIGITIHFSETTKIFYSNSLIKNIEIYIASKYLDFIILLSKETINDLAKMGVPSSKMHLLYTFHNFNVEEMPFKGNSMKKLLFVGSIDQRKGILDLLESLKEVKGDYQLHICGSVTRPDMHQPFDEACAILGKKIVFHGYVEGKEKEQIFSASDMLILPSYGEGMPIVIMEAMAMGCGIISTKVGAIPEIIDNCNGTLIEPGDKVALSKAISSYLSDSKKLKNIQELNFKKGKDYYINNNIRQLTAIYDKI